MLPFDLGDVCQNMWDIAVLGNNLNVELNVNVDTVGANPLFTLKPGGQTKVASKVFKTFQGNYFFRAPIQCL